MAKQVCCADVGPDCQFRATADTTEELLVRVAEHAREVHGIEEITPELKQQVLDAIEEV